MKNYKAVCTQDGCYNMVDEYEIKRNIIGGICERSKICTTCRTQSDKNAIHKWKQKQNKKFYSPRDQSSQGKEVKVIK